MLIHRQPLHLQQPLIQTFQRTHHQAVLPCPTLPCTTLQSETAKFHLNHIVQALRTQLHFKYTWPFKLNLLACRYPRKDQYFLHDLPVRLLGRHIYFSFKEAMELTGHQNNINKHGYDAIDKLSKRHDIQSDEALLSKGRGGSGLKRSVLWKYSPTRP